MTVFCKCADAEATVLVDGRAMCAACAAREKLAAEAEGRTVKIEIGEEDANGRLVPLRLDLRDDDENSNWLHEEE